MNPVALITGSGRKRIGNIIARALAQDGYRVAIHYHRSREHAEHTVQELQSLGIDACAVAADVADEQQVDAMFERVADRFQRLDVLVNTSSIWNSIPLEDVTADDVRRSFDVNTLGSFLCSRRAGLIMAEQASGGSIILIGDWAIARPYINHIAYFTAKGAIPTLTRTLAVELARKNPQVRVNCIHPGPVLFPEDLPPAQQQELIDATLVKAADCPESVTQAVRFLIDNSFVTGVCFPVDGGRSIFAPGSDGY